MSFGVSQAYLVLVVCLTPSVLEAAGALMAETRR